MTAEELKLNPPIHEMPHGLKLVLDDYGLKLMKYTSVALYSVTARDAYPAGRHIICALQAEAWDEEARIWREWAAIAMREFSDADSDCITYEDCSDKYVECSEIAKAWRERDAM